MALSVPLFVLGGLVLTPLYPVPPFDPPPDRIDQRYDEIFPYYVEYASMTRIKRRGEEPGGRHGHAVFYLKGVQRVADASYPRLELVAAGADLSNPNLGVGVSVNKILRNVNWVAFDGAELFYSGGKREGDAIDSDAGEEVVDRVLASGAFDGVEVYEAGTAGRPGGLRVDRRVLQRSIGTDFALRFGRDVACVRVPVPREVMGRIVEYLNGMNARYAENPDERFEWNGVENNCAHLVVNALAQVSALDAVQTDAGKVRRLFNLAIPANVLVDLAATGNEGSVDLDDVYGDEGARRSFVEDGWLLQQPGVVVRYLPRLRENNLLWEGDFDMYTMERPVMPLILVPPLQVIPIGSKWVWPPVYRYRQKAYRRLFIEPRFHDLKANLEHYLATTEERVSRPKTARESTRDQLYSDHLRAIRGRVVAALDRL
jgi:hypothetical protein